ncbi:MAG: hypothetical protein IPF78_11460, partial [Flavobacteriales bacterium]|nr:hypothetical protein [Flavobacteriales bacterium]
MKLAIDIGEAEPRTIVSGIAQHFKPELTSQQVVLLCNLETLTRNARSGKPRHGADGRGRWGRLR